VQLLDGLNFLHEGGITHRDIKPLNCLLDSNYHLKLADFGVAAHKNYKHYLTTYCGTIGYKAPEVTEDFDPYQGRPVDIFAVGMCLYTLVTGQDPFKSTKLDD